MNEFDRKFFISLMERMIKAYDCGTDKLPNNRCKHCPYGYGYLDDHGDYAVWWCNDEKLEEDAIKMLRILKEKI